MALLGAGTSLAPGTQPPWPAAPESREEGTRFLRDCVSLLWHRKWIILACFFLVGAGGVMYANRLPPIYVATSQIRLQPPQARNPISGFTGEYDGYAVFIPTQMAVICSQMIAEKVADQLIARGKSPYEARDQRRLAWEIKSGLAVERVPDTEILYVAMRHQNPVQAAELVNEVVGAYRLHVEQRRSASQAETADVFRKVVPDLEKKYKEVLDELNSFRLTSGFFPLGAKTNPYDELAGRMRLEKYQAEKQEHQFRLMYQRAAELSGAEVSEPKKREALFRQNLPQILKIPRVAGDPAVKELSARIYALEEERVALAAALLPGNEKLRHLERQLSAAKERLESEVQALLAAFHDEYLLAREQARLAEADFRRTDEDRSNFNKLSARHEELVTKLELAKDAYSRMAKISEQTNISARFDSEQVIVLESAAPPSRPTYPNKTKYALVAGLVGLLLGLGIAVLLEHLDDTVRSRDDLEAYVGLPLVGIVPQIRGMRSPGKRSLICLLHPRASQSEAFRTLRTSLLLAVERDGSKGIAYLVTSSGPLEGKTTIACNLAIVMAQAEKRTLLVDGDLRKPALHDIFQRKRKGGLSELLSVAEEDVSLFAQPTRAPNLWVLTAGQAVENPAELLNREFFARLMETLRGKFDIIIVDSPPLLVVTDAQIMSRSMDGVALVVRGRRSKKIAARRGRELLQEARASILGGILNYVEVGPAPYAYSYYYRYGQHQGEAETKPG